jgi:hypothetical protein
MSRNEAILAGIIAVVVVIGLGFWGYQGHLCKLEAIKAGMKGEEVVRACR